MNDKQTKIKMEKIWRNASKTFRYFCLTGYSLQKYKYRIVKKMYMKEYAVY